MKEFNRIIGQTMYAVLFVILLPLGLYFWGLKTEAYMFCHGAQSSWVAYVLSASGLSLLCWGMLALKIYGKGLPMNAYPPSQFVHSGPYRFFHHPIYIGFGLLVIGTSFLTGSASALWLVSPITLLGMTALVLGYENIDLKMRFPEFHAKVLFDLPEGTSEVIHPNERLIAFLRNFMILLVANFLLHQTSITDVKGSTFPLPGLEFLGNSFLQVICILANILLPVLLLKTKMQLRDWTVAMLIGFLSYSYIGVLYPETALHQVQDPVLSASANNSVPIFYWTLPLFYPILFVSKTSILMPRNLRFLIPGIAFISILIQFHNNIVSFDAIWSALGIYLISDHYKKIWSFLRSTSEQIANSWQEWVFGKVRIINHGFYVGMCAFTGIFIAGILSGSRYAWAIMIFCFLGVSFAAIWAQLIEGSEKLKRPFGYYGCLFSIPLAAFIFHYMGVDSWTIIAAVSVVMPWSQAIGRLRCLVNGCCHGSLVDNTEIGIRYWHPRSRVCFISGLKEKYIHPTPLYAILWLVPVGFVLLSLWKAGFMPSFIFGMYLILTGLGRFVEEAYRGEVQTRILKGLRLYQWTAIATVLIGIALTMLPTVRAHTDPGFSWHIFVAALAGGLFTFAAMGVDFPFSNKRFSRLV